MSNEEIYKEEVDRFLNMLTNMFIGNINDKMFEDFLDSLQKMYKIFKEKEIKFDPEKMNNEAYRTYIEEQQKKRESIISVYETHLSKLVKKEG